jgi:hypothetical protein
MIKMCEIVLRKVRTEQIQKYDVRICDPFWGFETPFAYKRCHGIMAVIANTGNENFSIKIDMLEKDMHIYTTEEHRMGIRYTVNTGSPILQYNETTNTYSETVHVKLHMGLNVIFWCTQKLSPRFYDSEEHRIQNSEEDDLDHDLNIQVTPGPGQVWDTYLFREMRKGYSGKCHTSPVTCGAGLSFFTIDRVSIARYKDKPASLLQQSWFEILKERVEGELLYFNLTGSLPLNRIPKVMQQVAFWHLIRLGNPRADTYPRDGAFYDTA